MSTAMRSTKTVTAGSATTLLQYAAQAAEVMLF